MAISTDRWLRKYESRTAVAEDDYRFGVQNPKRPPASAAIGARKTLETKMSSKATWDKWEAALKYVGDDGVIKAAVEKGAPRYVPGVRASLDKVRDFASKFAPYLEAGQKKVLSMPKVTLDDSIARSAAMIRHNAGFRYKK